jgi:hypothetical protein
MRDQLRSGGRVFEFLDAAQLVKHAFGLVTDGRRRGKAAVLIYLFAEPPSLDGRILTAKFALHRHEIAQFAEAVAGSAVAFHALSYRDWLSSWPLQDGAVAEHGKAVLARFNP